MFIFLVRYFFDYFRLRFTYHYPNYIKKNYTTLSKRAHGNWMNVFLYGNYILFQKILFLNHRTRHIYVWSPVVQCITVPPYIPINFKFCKLVLYIYFLVYCFYLELPKDLCHTRAYCCMCTQNTRKYTRKKNT